MTASDRRLTFWNILLVLLLAVSIGRLWLMKLPSSFWVDEMVTAFVIHFGASHPSLAIAPQVTETIYYWLPRVSERLFGFSEAAYRIPSVIVMGAALFFIARLAARLIHPQAGWLAVFGCLAMRGINYEAADARPYALGIAIAAAAVWFLVRWLDSGSVALGLAFVVLAALLWRVQLVFWPFYAVFILYAVTRMARSAASDATKVPWVHILAIFALLGLALVPVAMQALSLLRQAGAHVIVSPPTFRDLRRTLRFGLILECGVGAFLLGLVFRWRRNPEPFSLSALVLIVGWWLCDPLILFGFSRLTGSSLFVDRYLSLALPGVALTAALLASRFLPDQFWKPAAAILAIGGLYLLGQWHEPWPRHDNSDWRTAAERIDHLGLAADTPVICPSPFIEARPPVWKPDYPLPSFLYCHLTVYRVAGTPILFPFDMPPEGIDYAETLTKQTLAGSGRFVIYGGDRAAHNWQHWFAARRELAGWRNTELGPFGNISVVLFERGTRE